MMSWHFFERLQNNGFAGNLDDAKVLLSFCPRKHDSDVEVAAAAVTTANGIFTATQAGALRLQKLVHDAVQLESRSSTVLKQCTALLQTNCYSRKEEVRTILLKLSEIKSNFNNPQSEQAVKLLGKKDLSKNVKEKVRGLSWLVGTFAYDLFYVPVNNENTDQIYNDRIHYTNLQDLHDNPLPEKYLDKEIVRVSTTVKDLWARASAWQTMASTISASRDDKSDDDFHVVRLDALNALIENDILSKVRTNCVLVCWKTTYAFQHSLLL
jgi:hypothetical protein